MQEFDIIVIGAGPAGYVAAIKLAQLGHKVACIDKNQWLGGTCLNVGCIPSKALLHSSYKYYEAQHHFAEYGVDLDGVKLSLSKMMERKSSIVANLGKGISGLFSKNKVTYFQGTAELTSTTEVKIALNSGRQEKLKGQKIVIATGSEPISLPGINIDEKQILSSTGALSLPGVPKRMLILGGGVIGLEMGSVWSRLGSEVTIIEYADRILASSDIDISREVQKILEKQGMKFRLSTKALSASTNGNQTTLQIDSAGTQESLECEALLVAIGRRAYTQGLGLEKIGIECDKSGKVVIGQDFCTKVPNIFAIGDVVAGAMLAHKASEEGIAVAEIISGEHGHINYNAIPGIIYTHPEVASIGQTEEQLKAQRIAYNIGKFPFLANSRGRMSSEMAGFVKILACKKTDEVLGAHIIGPCAGELITEISLAMEFKAASEDIARTSHPHPGFSEAIKEAALATFSKAIHI